MDSMWLAGQLYSLLLRPVESARLYDVTARLEYTPKISLSTRELVRYSCIVSPVTDSAYEPGAIHRT